MMASVEEPEVQFAQRLASNEKPLRRKALKKLRSYIGARSRSQTGFSEEELLKLWKGLFYCLWMQDKPLLQEELSTQISGLVHHFHSFSAQLLYLQTFLTTVKREWTGIDRLRMDKYFQLVRFMFRQMFEVLQRSQWEPSCVRLFLELLSSALLQTGAPPVGLQLHVLDLYLRELAVVGAQELSADQNLVFIEPFCKAAAKTKDRSLFRTICSGIFSTIIDQAPFAIQELMDELQQDSDSGQASDDSGTEEPERESKGTRNVKTKDSKRVNGLKAHSEEEDEGGDDDGGDDEEDDGLSDSEKPLDEDVGPVLQFDYGAVADKLLELSSRHNTPSRNRQRLYKIIKVLRDLSQGSFPQDEYPDEVSTDEDDDDFGSRKRLKRRHTEEEEQEPEVKKAKGKKKPKKEEPLPPSSEQNSDASSQVKKKKRKKKKKKPQSQTAGATEAAEVANDESAPQLQPDVQPQVQPEPSEPGLENGHTETTPKGTKKKRKRTKKTEQQHSNQTEGQSAPAPKLTSSTSETQEPSEGPADQKSNAAVPEEVENTAPQKTPKKKKSSPESAHAEPGSEHQEATNDSQHEDPGPLEQNKKKDPTLEKAETPEPTVKTQKKRKATGQKKKKKKLSQPEPEEEAAGTEKKKKKRKITVEFEYEADEVQAESLSPDNGSVQPADPPKIEKQQSAQSDFVSFQSSSPPAPLFCRARGPHKLLSRKTKAATPRSESKKVRFGLKNNQMAEFRKSDRSLLLSPEGTSRVPFDPEQKPKCGVLKSPPTPFPKQKKKKKTAAPARTQKKTGARPTAADFF